VKIERGSWPVLPVFELIEKYGKVDNTEMHQVFNMGIGMTVIVSDAKADSILRSVRRRGHGAWIIGSVTRGSQRVELA
jgi:phosphoribosylformylglycinamidine cyclo-ligase